MSDDTIRLAEPGEYESAGRVTLEAYRHDGMDHVHIGYDAELRDAERRAASAELLIAVDHDGTLLGTVTFCRAGTPYAEISEPGEAEFRMLGVAPSSRGRGVGEALVKACIERAQEHGDRALVLSTTPMMRAAHRLYERLGFRRVPDRDWSPEPTVELIAYRLGL